MTPLETALAFVHRFCANDWDALEPLLCEDFRLQGPFARFDSRAAYLADLRGGAPEPATYEVLGQFAAGPQVALFYVFAKAGVRTDMAQLFTFRDGCIAEVRLVFDGRAFG